jgi:hypothetical protein
MKTKEFTVKENDGFKLRVKSWKCMNPSDLNAIEFIQESKNKKGEIDLSSTYQFFMTDEELKTLAQGIVNE